MMMFIRMIHSTTWMVPVAMRELVFRVVGLALLLPRSLEDPRDTYKPTDRASFEHLYSGDANSNLAN